MKKSVIVETLTTYSADSTSKCKFTTSFCKSTH